MKRLNWKSKSKVATCCFSMQQQWRRTATMGTTASSEKWIQHLNSTYLSTRPSPTLNEDLRSLHRRLSLIVKERLKRASVELVGSFPCHLASSGSSQSGSSDGNFVILWKDLPGMFHEGISVYDQRCRQRLQTFAAAACTQEGIRDIEIVSSINQADDSGGGESPHRPLSSSSSLLSPSPSFLSFSSLSIPQYATFIDPITDLRCTVSIGDVHAVEVCRMLKAITSVHPIIPMLIHVVKSWAKARGLVKRKGTCFSTSSATSSSKQAPTGKESTSAPINLPPPLSSYSLSLMVVMFLQEVGLLPLFTPSAVTLNPLHVGVGTSNNCSSHSVPFLKGGLTGALVEEQLIKLSFNRAIDLALVPGCHFLPFSSSSSTPSSVEFRLLTEPVKQNLSRNCFLLLKSFAQYYQRFHWPQGSVSITNPRRLRLGYVQEATRFFDDSFSVERKKYWRNFHRSNNLPFSVFEPELKVAVKRNKEQMVYECPMLIEDPILLHNCARGVAVSQGQWLFEELGRLEVGLSATEADPWSFF